MFNVDVNETFGGSLIIGDGIQTANVMPTANTAYQRGDLLVIDPMTNTATHSTNANDWSVICVEDVTAEQADSHAAKEIEIPVYTQAEINVFECKINGVKLTKAQRTTAQGRANTATSLELRKPQGIADV